MVVECLTVNVTRKEENGLGIRDMLGVAAVGVAIGAIAVDIFGD